MGLALHIEIPPRGSSVQDNVQECLCRLTTNNYKIDLTIEEHEKKNR